MTKAFALGRRASSLGDSFLCLTALVAITGVALPAQADDKSTGKGLVIGWSQRGISGSDWWKTMVAGGQHEADKMARR